MDKIYINYKKTQQKLVGFSLIELMVVVAIAGVISSIAIPAYTNYTVKAKVSNGMAALDNLKKTANDYYMENNVFFTSTVSPYTDDLIVSSKITPITSFPNVTINTGEAVVGFTQITFSATASIAIRNKSLSLVAIENSNIIKWQCLNGDESGNNKIDLEVLPSVCK